MNQITFKILMILQTINQFCINEEVGLKPNLSKVMQMPFPMKLRAAVYYSNTMKSNKPSNIALDVYYKDAYLKTSQTFAWHNIQFIVTHEFYGDYVDSSEDIKIEYEKFKQYIRNIKESFADTYLLLRNVRLHLNVGESGVFGYGQLGGIGTTFAISIIEAGRAVSWKVSYVGNLIAHEVGHNMFLNHSDSSECTCAFPLEKCIMNSISYDLMTYQSTFDSCSIESFKKLRLDVKISDKFKQKNIYEICGNGIVEDGEECDCATPEICLIRGENNFCDYKTCKLYESMNKTNKFTCSSGPCCKDGYFVQAGNFCNDSQKSDCLYEAYCTGFSSTCPRLPKPDGTSCNSSSGRCMNGICITLQTNCEMFYPIHNLEANDSCYAITHIKKINYLEACGPIMCSREGIKSQNLDLYLVLAEKCFIRYDMKKPTAIDGTPCGDNRMCVNSVCNHVDDFNKCKNVLCPHGSVCVREGVCQSTSGYISATFYRVLLLSNLSFGVVIYLRKHTYDLFTKFRGT